MQPHDPLSRRNFIGTTSLLAGGLIASPAAATDVEPLASERTRADHDGLHTGSVPRSGCHFEYRRTSAHQ